MVTAGKGGKFNLKGLKMLCTAAHILSNTRCFLHMRIFFFKVTRTTCQSWFLCKSYYLPL